MDFSTKKKVSFISVHIIFTTDALITDIARVRMLEKRDTFRIDL